MSAAPDRFALDDHADATVALAAAHQAYESHLAGHSWPVITEEVGYASAKVCHMAVTAYLQKAAVEQTPERRREALQVEAARLDALQVVYWDRARRGDLKAAQLVVKIITERIKLRNPTGKAGAASIDDERQRVLVVAGSSEQYTEQLKAIVAQGLAETDEDKDAAIARCWDTDAPPDAHGHIYPKGLLEAVERELVAERRQQPALDVAPSGEGPAFAPRDRTAPASDGRKAAGNRTRRSAGHVQKRPTARRGLPTA
jgi:hypothetical protein